MKTLTEILREGLELPNETEHEQQILEWHVKKTVALVKGWLEPKRQGNIEVLHEKRCANGECGKSFYRGRVYEDEQLLAELKEDAGK